MKRIEVQEVQVRRHNGQCPYGPWLRLSDPDVPYWVREAMYDATEPTGHVVVGGQRWDYEPGSTLAIRT